MSKVDNRKNSLLNLLQMTDSISVQEIADYFSISLPVARRLCSQLAEEGKVIRFHGGIRSIDHSVSTYSFDQLLADHNKEKERIAMYASGLVNNNEVVFVEAGTTLYQFSICLAERIRKKEVANVSIFTNSLINLEIFSAVSDRVYVIGGHYRDSRKDFTGYLSCHAIDNLQFNHAFIGADAISLTEGIMAMDADTVNFDSQLIKHSEKNTILAHSAKFSRKSLISYASTDEITAIITDNALDPTILESYLRQNIDVVTV